MKKKKFVFYLLTAASLLLLLTPATLGQSNAQLDGVVKDASAAVIPGVEVTLTNNVTNLSTTVITSDTGRFVFVNVRPGEYTLSAELSGFKRSSNPNVSLEVGDTRTLDIALETGTISEEVTVTSETPPVDRVSQSIRAVVDEKRIANLPLVGRNPMNLFFLQAGANRVGSGGAGRINGLRNTTSNVQIEGIASNDNMLTGGATQSLAPVIVEAMAEFSVTTSSAAAEAGLGGGAQVQMVYKSGSNEFHGRIYEFHRNKALNANGFFRNRQGLDTPAFRRHQYGFAVGGPIIKDRAFFHFTYENITQVQDATTQRTVWTDRFKQTGVFQYVDTVDGLTKEIDLKTVDPTRQGMSSDFSSYASLLPSPNNNDNGDGFNSAGFRFSSSDPLDDWRVVLKGDYIVNDKHRMGISYADRRLDNPSASHILGHPNQVRNEKFPAGIFTLTSSFTPTFLNELRLGGTKRDWQTSNGDPRRFETAPLLNFNSLGGPARGTNANRSIFLPQAGPSATLTINDNATWIKGDHTFKGGIDIRINRSNVAFGGDRYIPVADTSNANNPATIPALNISGSDLGRAEQALNDVTGTLGLLRQDFQQVTTGGDAFVPFETKLRKWRSREYSFFFQDTWKFNDRLTLQLGARYEVLPSHFEANGIFSYPIDGSGNACVECAFGISGPGTTALGLLPSAGRDIYETDWNNFAPNVGFTWDLFGDGKTTLASNYRVAYDRNPLVNTLFQDFNQEGASTVINVLGSQVANASLANAESLSLGINPGVPFGPKPFNRDGIVMVWDPNYATPYVQSWSLRLQREVARNTVLEVAYVGNHAVGEPRAVDLNQLNLRDTGFLDGFLVAQSNLASSGNPLVGADTGVFGQIWSTLSSAQAGSQNSNISRGETAAVAEYIDDTLKGAPLAAAGLPDNFFRLNPQFENVELLGQNSHSTFHGLRLDVRRRFTDGLQFQANYAFGKGLTDYEGGQSQRNAFRDNENRGLDKSRSAADARHIVNANAIYELPFGRGRRWANFSNGVAEAFLGGWQVNGILSFSSGQPITVRSTGRNNLTNGDHSTVTFAGTDPTIGSSVNTSGLATPNAFTASEKALFSHPVAGSAGFTAQRYFTDASFWVLDSSLFKSFRTPWFAGEDSELQFRFEFFNATNSTTFNQFQRNLVSSNFGNITGARANRIVQVALKFIF